MYVPYLICFIHPRNPPEKGAHLAARPGGHPGVPHRAGGDRDLRGDTDAAHPRPGVPHQGAAGVPHLRLPAVGPAGQDLRADAAGVAQGVLVVLVLVAVKWCWECFAVGVVSCAGAGVGDGGVGVLVLLVCWWP